MKRFLLSVLLAFMVSTVSVAQNDQSKAGAITAAEQELMTLERDWNEAYKNRSRLVLERLLADDFIFTDDEGHVYTKADYIDAVIKLIKVVSYTTGETTVRVHGNTGVVAGRWAGILTIDGADASGAFRFTDTFIKSQGSWRVLASQDTRIPKPKE
jgi:ketosteroid isomerase-like protein